MKEQFRYKKFQKKNVILLEKIKEILEEFDTQGIRVTLRQLYYQLVPRDIMLDENYSKINTAQILSYFI